MVGGDETKKQGSSSSSPIPAFLRAATFPPTSLKTARSESDIPLAYLLACRGSKSPFNLCRILDNRTRSSPVLLPFFFLDRLPRSSLKVSDRSPIKAAKLSSLPQLTSLQTAKVASSRDRYGSESISPPSLSSSLRYRPTVFPRRLRESYRAASGAGSGKPRVTNLNSELTCSSSLPLSPTSTSRLPTLAMSVRPHDEAEDELPAYTRRDGL